MALGVVDVGRGGCAFASGAIRAGHLASKAPAGGVLKSIVARDWLVDGQMQPRKGHLGRNSGV